MGFRNDHEFFKHYVAAMRDFGVKILVVAMKSVVTPLHQYTLICL